MEACQPILVTDVEKKKMLLRFQQIGGALRTLLADDAVYDDAVQLQRAETEDFTTVRRAFAGI